MIIICIIILIQILTNNSFNTVYKSILLMQNLADMMLNLKNVLFSDMHGIRDYS